MIKFYISRAKARPGKEEDYQEVPIKSWICLRRHLPRDRCGTADLAQSLEVGLVRLFVALGTRIHSRTPR